MTQALILLAHGARDPNWALPFEQVATHVRTILPGLEVRLAFLEFMAPNLVTAGQELAQLGCLKVDVLPLFLGAGGHVRKDVPSLLVKLQANNPQVQWQIHAAIGEHLAVIESMAQVAASLLNAHPTASESP